MFHFMAEMKTRYLFEYPVPLKAGLKSCMARRKRRSQKVSGWVLLLLLEEDSHG
jgi:hypothetical protein